MLLLRCVGHFQVIEEIEEMMRDSPDMEAEQNPSQSDLSMVSLDVQQAASYEKGECLLMEGETSKNFYTILCFLLIQNDHNLHVF